MPVEQARNAAIDRRADVYAVGAILYEMLAGRAPFETDDGRNQVHTLQQILSGTIPPELPSSVPPVIRAITVRALAHDREKRFATAMEMSRALDDAARATGLTATALDVATALEVPLQARAQKRRETVDAALKAAMARSEAGPILATPIDSASGVPLKPVMGSGTAFVPEETHGSITNVSSVLGPPKTRRRGAAVVAATLAFCVGAVAAFAIGRARKPQVAAPQAASTVTVTRFIEVPASVKAPPSATVTVTATATTTAAMSAHAHGATTTTVHVTHPHPTSSGDDYGF